jgi:iron complex outermembrane receptor protein
MIGARQHARLLCCCLVAWVIACPRGSSAQEGKELADLSLEELGNIEVTSVSRVAQPLRDAPASIFVITAEDIRRSGATSLPEALRLAPTLQIARIDAADYAISARGFNSATANKLLVLIDGRTVYTPLFSGVFWDVQDVVLEDIERIEVISGPGGTLWGTNAVNGVINVITRSAKATQGSLVSAGAGNRESGIAVRRGAALGQDGHVRVYGKFFDRQNTFRANGSEVPDDWHKGQIGFRSDWGGDRDSFTLQGDAYHGKLEQATPGTSEIAGANLLGSWSRRLANDSQLLLQGYIDHTSRDIAGVFGEQLDIFDIVAQHDIRLMKRHHVVWGAGYRLARDRVSNTAALSFLPADVDLSWWNVFAQDTIALTSKLEATFGLRLEHNSYTGMEELPSARLAWKLNPQHMVWGALSRAVRAPSRIDRDFFVPDFLGPGIDLLGGPDFRSEIADVLEVGYRGQTSPDLSYSFTVFRQIYDDLRSVEPLGGDFVLGNEMDGRSTGVEAWAAWRVSEHWRLSAGGMIVNDELALDAGSGDPLGTSAAGNDPDYQVILRSSHNITERLEFDIGVRHVAELPDPEVPAYTAVDARLGWQPRPDLELSLTGMNLFDEQHPEFGTPPDRSEVPRSFFAEAIWRF